MTYDPVATLAPRDFVVPDTFHHPFPVITHSSIDKHSRGPTKNPWVTEIFGPRNKRTKEVTSNLNGSGKNCLNMEAETKSFAK